MGILTRCFAVPIVFLGISMLIGEEETTMLIDFSSTDWIVRDDKARIEEYKGKRAMCLQGGLAYLRDLVFQNGVIECDIASPGKRSYLGVAFRIQSEKNYELIYFQPHTSGKWDAIQYDPVFNGSTTWQLHHGPKYQAEAVIPTQEWFHVKIVVSGLEAQVFLGNSDTPALVITDLQQGLSRGSVGVWSYHPGNMANLSVKPSSSTPENVNVNIEPPAIPYLNQWLISHPVVLDEQNNASLLEAARSSDTGWETVTSEESGIVNLNRHFTKPRGEVTVFAKLTLHSSINQQRKLFFGYSDKIAVFLNSEMIFSGDNSYGVSKQPGSRGYVKDGEFVVELPMKQRTNELLMAVSEKAFGWGFIARLDKAGGIRIESENHFPRN